MPCLSLLLNSVGVVLAVWAIVGALTSPTRFLPWPVVGLSALVIVLTVGVFVDGIVQKLRRTRGVLPERRDRVRFVLRTNPLFTLGHWLWWTVPLAKGFSMWIRDRGLVWERTEKIDANNVLVRTGVPDLDRARGSRTHAPR